MASNFTLNDSMLSSASAMSAIGLERTMTEAFQDLKGVQAEVQEKVTKVNDFYERVKDYVVDDSQNGSGAILMELEQFDEDRHAAVEALAEYYARTAIAVNLHIDADSKKREKKIHRFVNNMKMSLLRTEEMAAEEYPNVEDQQFLKDQGKTFPVGMLPAVDLELPVASTPAKTNEIEKKSVPKGFSEIRSTYTLRGKELVEKIASPAKKAFANLSLNPKTNAACQLTNNLGNIMCIQRLSLKY